MRRLWSGRGGEISEFLTSCCGPVGLELIYAFFFCVLIERKEEEKAGVVDAQEPSSQFGPASSTTQSPSQTVDRSSLP